MFCCAAALALLVSPAQVSAHNTLASSNPVDGAVLEVAPTELQLVFDSSVPLDTVSAQFIDGSGVRTEITGFAHGPSGDTEVLAPFPALPAGEVTIRWRLVGPDGHPVTGRIEFTIAAATVPLTTVAPDAAVVYAPSTTAPAIAADPATGGDGFDEPWAAPSWLRWLLRYVSYVAILAIGGVMAATALVWPGAWSQAVLHRVVQVSVAVVAGAGFAQLLVIASDITGSPPWSAMSGIGAAMETDAGRAFAIRLVLVAVLAAVLFGWRTMSDANRLTTVGMLVIGLLGTWAFAGHSRSMRYPWLGVPLDVAHHAAAAVWVGGLAVVGLVAIRVCDTDEVVDVVNRFASVAAVSVGVIVATGAAQTLRLVGSPTALFGADHGRYLVVKLVVLAAMLKVADVNRRRVARRFQSATTTTPLAVHNLARAMATEFGTGLAVIAVTAAMVVSPPASASSGAPRPSALAGAASSATADTTTTTTTTTAPPPGVAGSTIAAVEPACTVTGTPLSLGAQGDDVVCLQSALAARDVYADQASGTFDEATDVAVRAFQAADGLLVDGVVGPATGEALGIWP
ncbi:MAG TPA: CopD family protein [Ilumatobacter sp.]|nr:CopD family protein [Ilumatobacter sp.]